MLATQNPIEQEGTYPLPEAQVDRFMLKLRVGYPTREEERQILDRMATTANHRPASPVVTTADIIAARALVDQVYVDDKVQGLHREPRLRDARAEDVRPRPRAADRVRRVAARDDLPDARRRGRTRSSRAAAT